jgi:hypothetical protein
VVSLNGAWLFQTNGAAAGSRKTVPVPSAWETHEGARFDGLGWYRRQITPPAIPPGKRLLLHFQAAATEAEVWWNGRKLGAHLGGWTPFRFDVTRVALEAAKAQECELRVRLDEKVGHNTQGFLPVIQPHFGGLWQDAQLLVVPETYLDDLSLRATGNPKTGRLELVAPVLGTPPTGPPSLVVRWRLRGASAWSTARLGAAQNSAPQAAAGFDLLLRREGNSLVAEIPVPNPRRWFPAEPNLYELELELPAPDGGMQGGDVVQTRAAFRTIEAFGAQLRLNGLPLQVRGLLNWGYYPPGFAPDPGEAVFRRDLELVRAWGFNLMKFCLWVPPKRFLELADELGVLAWMEYPTWHPRLTAEFLAPLQQEFEEFFCHDRNHPSVILRSLTCETGPSAEWAVIQSLYDQAHRMIPGALVEDDSSWIEWNRIHDFYDDHPYGNNHTWLPTLRAFNDYILAHGPKPMLVGEGIAADTWPPREALAERANPPRPFWFPTGYDGQADWIERMRSIAGPGGLEALLADSLRYGMLMRKYQAEVYRREVPYGGYVVTVIRDVATAPTGLLDYLERPKWPAADWSWHRDTMSLLKTEDDRRSFASGERLKGDLLLSHFGPVSLVNSSLMVALEQEGRPAQQPQRAERRDLAQKPGTLAKVLDLDFPLPRVTRPTRLWLRSVVQTPNETFSNEWPLWLLPAPPARGRPKVWAHPSLAPELARELFPTAKPLGKSIPDGLVVTARFDDALVRVLEQGGRVLLLPDGQPASLPLSAHWFMRGGPYVPRHRVTEAAPHDFWVELQHFDLARDVVPDLTYLEDLDPILMLWDIHEQRAVKTHGLMFATRAGQGRLLVSAVRHHGGANAAGKWLLGVLLEELAQGPPPRHALSAAHWRRLKEKLHEDKIPLVDRPWRFRPDPRNEGLEKGWHSPAQPEAADWTDIRIGRSWEAEGHATLDGWAWYRLAIDIPRAWQGRPVFLSFEGVDDLYEAYVNGKLAGKGGDLAGRQSAFFERKSHDITRLVEPGARCLLAVRVHDWYGAGGIFRPVTVGTTELITEGEILK